MCPVSENNADESNKRGPHSEAVVPKTKTVENYDFPVAQTKIFISAASRLVLNLLLFKHLIKADTRIKTACQV